MMVTYQRTLQKPAKMTGVGIHSGTRVSMVLHPAAHDTGIVFHRVDLPSEVALPLPVDTQVVGATENNTSLGQGRNCVHTIEHLMAALFALGINNLRIEIDGPEVPIMDGSSASFLFLLKEAGVAELPYARKYLRIKKTVRVDKDGKWAQLSPCDHYEISSSIVFAHPLIKQQQRTFQFSQENFIRDISRARTFGFLKDVDSMKRRGLARGGSLDNAIVLGDYQVINPEGLRFSDEFVRHKILDIVGDFALLGRDILGHITTFKSGHNVHNLLCRKLLSDPTAYEEVSAHFVTSPS